MNDKEYIQAVSKINIPPEMKERILTKSINANHQSRKENNIMKFKKKIAIVAVAAAMILGVTAFASSGIITSWNSSSSSIPNYKSLPSYEQCVKDAGYAPVLINSFVSGYTFKDGSLVNNNLTDENGNSVEKFKSFSFRYGKGNDKVTFSADKYSSNMKTTGEVIDNIDGIDIYINEYTNKFVPGNYELTEEDKAAQESGELVFSFGADDVKICDVKNVLWSDGDIHYTLTQIDGKLSPEDLAEMAKEVIMSDK